MIKPGSGKRRFLCEMIGIFEKDHLQFQLVKMFFWLEMKYIRLWVDRHLTREQKTQTLNKTWSSVMVCPLALAGIDHIRQVDIWHCVLRGFPGVSSGKESACQCRRGKRQGFNSWVWKISWRRKWQLIPVDLLGKFHGRRRLVVYSPQSRKESDTTEYACLYAHTHTVQIGRQENTSPPSFSPW